MVATERRVQLPPSKDQHPVAAHGATANQNDPGVDAAEREPIKPQRYGSNGEAIGRWPLASRLRLIVGASALLWLLIIAVLWTAFG